MTITKIIITYILLLFGVTCSFGRTLYAVANGNFENATTWSLTRGGVPLVSSPPTCGDILIISVGVTVSVTKNLDYTAANSGGNPTGSPACGAAMYIKLESSTNATNCIGTSKTCNGYNYRRCTAGGTSMGASAPFTYSGELYFTGASKLTLPADSGVQAVGPGLTGDTCNNSNKIDIAGTAGFDWDERDGPVATLGNITPLPVSLVTFSGKYNARKTINELSWITESEQNFSYFLLEYSTNGTDFSDIANVGAMGIGSVTTYNYEHKEFAEKINYYRLKIVDKDLTYKYSKIISIIVPEKASFTVFYGTDNSVGVNYVSTNEETVQIELYDVLGRKLFSKDINAFIGENRIELETSGLSPAIYLVRLRSKRDTFSKQLKR